jgi:hypothetical protein
MSVSVGERYVAQQSGGRRGPSGLADVLDVLLDKGLVVDAFVRVSLVGIELLTVDARIVIAGVDTYLHFAEAVNRLDLLQAKDTEPLQRAFSGGGGRGRGRERGHGGEREQQGGSDGNGHRPRLESGGRQESGQQARDHGGRAAQEQSAQHDDDNPQHDDDKGILARLIDKGRAF